jgi:hypothetical protein
LQTRIVSTVKNHDTRKDVLPKGVIINQLAQSFFAHEQPAVAHDAEKGAGILDELAAFTVQKTENRSARREQEHVHLIFEQNARVVGFNGDSAVNTGLEFRAVFVPGDAAADLGVDLFRIFVFAVQP